MEGECRANTDLLSFMRVQRRREVGPQSSPRRQQARAYQRPDVQPHAAVASAAKRVDGFTTTLQRRALEVASPQHQRRQGAKRGRSGSPLARCQTAQGTEAVQRTAGRAIAQTESVKIDQESFRSFWPLLDESRDYARLSGCRFRSRSFEGVGGPDADFPTEEVSPPDNEENRLARERAAPAVYSFARRLRSGEPSLLQELERAYHIVMAESVRSAMIATCKLMELWPPTPTPPNIALYYDCNFKDFSADVPTIAQRLYNDEERRRSLAARRGELDPVKRQAMMATFIVEFATAAGVSLPDVTAPYDEELQRFQDSASSWEDADAQRRAAGDDEKTHGADENAWESAGAEMRLWPEMFSAAGIASAWTKAMSFSTSATAECGSGRMSRPWSSSQRHAFS